MSDPRVSAVIVTWNSEAVIGGCIRSLVAAAPAGGLEVVVVDNASADGTIAAARAADPGVRIVANPTNRGLAAANNQGIAAARGELVLVCNPDLVVGPAALTEMAATLDRHPRAAWAIPRLVGAGGEPQTAVGDLPSLGEALLGRQWQRRRSARSGFWWDGWAHDAEVTVGHGMEACYLVRQAAIESFGAQDERYRLDWEGIDWSERAHRAGWEIVFCPAAEVVHAGGGSIRRAQSRWVISSHRGMYRYFADRRPAAWRPLLAVAFALRALAKLAGARLRLTDYAAGHRAATGRRAAGGRLLVLHVLEALEGGTARHLVDVVASTPGVDHVVVIPEARIGGLTDRAAAGRLADLGAEVMHVRMRRSPFTATNLAALGHLTRLVRARRPDVVHAHSSIGGVLGRLAALGTGTPVVYTPNGVTDVRVGLAVERLLARRTAALVAVSPSEAALAAAVGIARRERIAVVPNGVSRHAPVPIDLRGRLGIDRATPLVGTVSRLVDQKDPLGFVAACAAVARRRPGTRFVLIGDGALRPQVEAAVAAAGLGEALTLIPELAGAAGALGDLDVYVLASRFEGGPYTPLEAMRAGTPVVLSDVVGNRDAVVNGESGVLVAPGDPQAVADAVVALLDDPDRRARFAAAGRARVAEAFDLERSGALLDDLYHRVAAAGRP